MGDLDQFALVEILLLGDLYWRNHLSHVRHPTTERFPERVEGRSRTLAVHHPPKTHGHWREELIDDSEGLVVDGLFGEAEGHRDVVGGPLLEELRPPIDIDQLL